MEELDINANEVSHTDPDYDPAGDDPTSEGLKEDSTDRDTGSIADDDLDEWGDGVYLCRWPNGDFSVVKPDTKREALVELDQWAGAEVSVSSARYADLLAKVFDLTGRGLSRPLAESILSLDFPESDAAQAAELNEKANEGILSRMRWLPTGDRIARIS